MPNENFEKSEAGEPLLRDEMKDALNIFAEKDSRPIPFAEWFLKEEKKEEQEEKEIPMDSYEDTRGISSSSSDGVYPDVIEGFDNLPGGGRIRKNKL